MTIQPGSLVRLKSGGPKMTVDSVDSTQQHANCSWFKGKKHRRAQMSLATLHVLKGKKKSAKPLQNGVTHEPAAKSSAHAS